MAKITGVGGLFFESWGQLFPGLGRQTSDSFTHVPGPDGITIKPWKPADPSNP